MRTESLHKKIIYLSRGQSYKMGTARLYTTDTGPSCSLCPACQCPTESNHDVYDFQPEQATCTQCIHFWWL